MKASFKTILGGTAIIIGGICFTVFHEERKQLVDWIMSLVFGAPE